MKRNFSVLAIFLGFLAVSALPTPALADSSHARIVRLSLVQGDVRFAQSFHDDPLTDPKTIWERGALNLPLRQGNVLATDSGRAEVEFENGAMAFLGANTVIEFYDLSLRDGARITRLVLRQGTATLYVNPSNGDYFSVTGGDFTVEANGRTTFRLDNFDDGSIVNVDQGRVVVLRDNKPTPLTKGQSIFAQAGSTNDLVVGRSAEPDDFDHWVSGRVESVVTATNYSNQYVSSPNYSSGFSDLYTYGSWLSLGGYGYGWRPFGVGLGWSPFDYGNFYYDNSMGWGFIGSAPWGWLPYHYGSWIQSPVYGWVWAPTGFGYGGPIHYRPVTATWVRAGNTLGLVPVHPSDKNGKTPANLAQGIFPVQSHGVAAQPTAIATGEKVVVLKEGPREAFAEGSLAPSSSPARVSRTILSGASGNRAVTLSRESSISYDPREHRFVNGNSAPPAAAAEVSTGASSPKTAERSATSAIPQAPRNNAPAAAPRTTLPARPPAMPAPARTTATSTHGSNGTPNWNTGFGSGNSSGSTHPSASTPAAHPSTGGGRPH
jgi:FecR protein